MKSVSRLMLGMAVVGVTFVALESQADAFFGRLGRGGGWGHHHHGCHVVSHCPPVCAAPVVCPPACDPCVHVGHHHHRRGLFRGRHRCHGGWGHCAPACPCGGVIHGDVYHGEVIDGVPDEEPAPAAPEEPADAAPRA